MKLTQPVATVILAIALGSVPFTLPLMSNAQLPAGGSRWDPLYIECLRGCK